MTNEQQKPFIQIDDVVREMTDEEYAIHLELISAVRSLPESQVNNAD